MDSNVLPYTTRRLSHAAHVASTGAGTDIGNARCGRATILNADGADFTVTAAQSMTTSHIMATQASVDAGTPDVLSVVPGNGSFVIHLSVGPTASLDVDFVIFNPQS